MQIRLKKTTCLHANTIKLNHNEMSLQVQKIPA